MKRCLAFVSLAAATNFIAPPRDAMARETKVASNNMAMQMIEIAPATYRAGTNNGFWDTRPAHDVRISHVYRMATLPVSNAQYEIFDPKHKATRAALETLVGDDDPVRFVTWQQAVDYCAWLSERTGMIELISSGVHYRFNAAWLQQTHAVEPFTLVTSKEAIP